MSSIKWFLGVLLLVPGVGRAAPLPGQVTVQVSPQSCVVGQPVTVTFRVTRPVGKIVFWNLTDRAFSPATLLTSETCAMPVSDSQHEVVFTATQGGPCELGPFAVVIRSYHYADTLYAPRLRVQFRAEALRSSLHPLRGIAAGRQGWGSAQPGTWGVAGLLCLGLGASWLLWEKLKNRPSAWAPASSPAQTQKRALAKLAALEQAMQANALPADKLPDQLFRIVTECLTQLPAPAAADKAALAELSQARFAPGQAGEHGAANLIAQAKQLVASWELPTQPARQRV